MRCNGLPNTNCPSDLRKYLHQWQNDINSRNRESRNWLLKTDELTLLTQDTSVKDLTQATLRKQQGNLGDIYACRIEQVLTILAELNESLHDRELPLHTVNDLEKLRTEIRVFLKDYIDDFTYKIMSHRERDMEIDRPGVSKHVYTSNVFKTFVWSFSKDAQIGPNSKTHLVNQDQHFELEFPIMKIQISLPPSVVLHNSALRGLWLNYDHFSDYCPSFKPKRTKPPNTNMLTQIKKEWRKRKEILSQMLEECNRELPLAELEPFNMEKKLTVQQEKEANKDKDIDKLYSDYEEVLNKLRRRVIGPEGYNLMATDVNLRKYHIIGGVYNIDYLDTPQQDKQLNARTFIRTILTPNKLSHKVYFETYKPPPPPQAGVRRLPEEIEAEMRMMEKALHKLALVTVQLPDSVIWFEPPIVCRWETQADTLESNRIEGIQETHPLRTARDSIDLTPSSTNPLKMILPDYDAKKLRKKSLQKYSNLSVKRIVDFNMCHIPGDVDIFSLLEDYILPRLPTGFSISLDMSKKSKGVVHEHTNKLQNGRAHRIQTKPAIPKLLFLSRPKVKNSYLAGHHTYKNVDTMKSIYQELNVTRFTKNCFDLNEPREFCSQPQRSKILQIQSRTTLQSHQLHSEKKDVEEKLLNNQTKDTSLYSSENIPEIEETKCYMFSTLIEDLDRLQELQMPLQRELMQQISSRCSRASFVYNSELEKLDEELTNLQIEADNDNSMDVESNSDDELLEEELLYEEKYERPAETSLKCHAQDKSTSEDEEFNNVSNFPTKQSINNVKNNAAEIDQNKKMNPTNAITHGKWSTRDVHDTKFNEDKLSIQFRTGRLGIFGFALNRYTNMPYQTWELKPDLKNPGTILFSLTASLISLEMTVKSDGYCINNFQGGTTTAISDMIGKTLSLAAIKKILVHSAVDIFPEEDAFCYTEGSCEKNFVMEMHLYNCMSTLALSHNFSWSRWNLLAGSRTAVLLMRELVEGKKMPNHSTLLVTPLKTSIINCTEVSTSFNCLGIVGMDYYADLYQLAKVHAHPFSLEKQLKMHPVLRDHIAALLMATRPLSFC